MKKQKFTFDDVVAQYVLCHCDCRRLIHSLNELKKMFVAVDLCSVEFNSVWLEEAMESADECLSCLNEIHYKNGSYAEDEE